eukprot:923447_1
MSGMFIHRNYLCFLWHDVFAPLRKIVGELNQKYGRDHKVKGNISSLTITTLVTQLSGKIPALYPMVQQTWKTKESLHSNVSSRRLTETSELEVEHNNMFDNISIERRRRFSWDLNDIEVNDRFEKREEEGRRKLQAKNTDEHLKSTIDLTYEDASSVLKYFGSFSRGQSCWCKRFVWKQKQNNGCHDQCMRELNKKASAQSTLWLNADSSNDKMCD